MVFFTIFYIMPEEITEELTLWEEILLYLKENYFSASVGDGFTYLQYTQNAATTLFVVMVGLCLGMLVACFTMLYQRNVMGKFVRELIREKAHGPDTAKSLSELGFTKAGLLRLSLSTHSPLRKTVNILTPERILIRDLHESEITEEMQAEEWKRTEAAKQEAAMREKQERAEATRQKIAASKATPQEEPTDAASCPEGEICAPCNVEAPEVHSIPCDMEAPEVHSALIEEAEAPEGGTVAEAMPTEQEFSKKEAEPNEESAATEAPMATKAVAEEPAATEEAVASENPAVAEEPDMAKAAEDPEESGIPAEKEGNAENCPAEKAPRYALFSKEWKEARQQQKLLDRLPKFDFQRAKFYIPEERAYTAECRFAKEKRPVLGVILATLAFTALAVLLIRFTPTVLALMDSTLTSLFG